MTNIIPTKSDIRETSWDDIVECFLDEKDLMISLQKQYAAEIKIQALHKKLMSTHTTPSRLCRLSDVLRGKIRIAYQEYCALTPYPVSKQQFDVALLKSVTKR